MAEEAEALGLGYWVLTPGTREVRASGLCKRHFGCPADEELSYEALVRSGHPEAARTEEALRRTVEEGRGYAAEHRVTRPDGTVRRLLNRARRRRAPDGNPEVAGVTVEADGPDRGPAGFEGLVEHAADAAFAVGPGGGLVYANEAARRALGYGREELLSMSLPDIDVTLGGRGCAELSERARRGAVAPFESVYRRADGTTYPVEASAAVAAGGTVMLVTFRDIAARKEAEERLRESEERLRTLVETTASIVWRSGPDGELLEAEDWGSFTGQSRAEYGGSGWLRAVHPEDREAALAGLREGVAGGRETRAEYRLWHRPGEEYRHVSTRGVPVRDERGGVKEWVGTVTDIEDSRRTLRRLESAERRFRAVFEQAREAIMVHDVRGRFQEVNGAACKSLGYTREELLGMSVVDIERIFSRDEFGRLMRRVRAGESVSFEGIHERKDGTTFPVELTVGPFQEDGEASGEEGEGSPLALAVARDISRRRQIERAISSSERRFRALVEQSVMATQILAPDGASLLSNAAWRRLWGPDGNPDAASIFEDVPVAASGLLPYLEEASAGRTVETPPLFYDPVTAGREGGAKWLKAFVYPIFGDEPEEAGVHTGAGGRETYRGISEIVILVEDVTEFERVQQERNRAFRLERDARERTSFLAGASHELAKSLDYDDTVGIILRLATSYADWAVLHTDPRCPTALRVAHADPDACGEVAAMRESFTGDSGVPRLLREVAESGEPHLAPNVDRPYLRAAFPEGDQARLVEAAGAESLAVLPLRTHGRTFGTLTLVSADSTRSYGRAELPIMADFALRASQALDNARLYRERARTAETLQRSLMPPEPPPIPGVEVAARYRPAGEPGAAVTAPGEDHDVGGDFYDIFATAVGWGIVVGDVRGKGAEAAELTALARYTIRTAAMQCREPSGILSTLNAAIMNQREAHEFCTVALGFLSLASVEPRAPGASVPEASELAAPEPAARLRLCRGGHPAPLVLKADGAVEEAGVSGTPPGAAYPTRLADTDVDLHPADTLLLYTDGVTEARDGSGGFFGEERLRATLRSCAGLSAEETVRGLEEELARFTADAARRDDVILLALKVDPEPGREP